jgi:hypothetical protein
MTNSWPCLLGTFLLRRAAIRVSSPGTDPLGDSVLAQSRPFSRAPTPHPNVIYKRSQNAGSMSTLRIVKVVPGKWGTEFLEHRN